MTFATFCSGVGAPEVAWKPLGWRSIFASEIEPFACAVLAHHHADTPNLGNMEDCTREQVQQFGPVDALCAGTPCQSFSVAGLRGGMADPRGNLALVFLRLVDWIRPRWVVWENVPGVLSSGAGRDVGSFLGGLGQLGYGWCYRILDAQYFRVPQRRRRVFVVGCLGDWRGSAAVLLERQSLCWNPAPSRETGARVAASLTRGADSSGRGGYAGRRQEDDQNIVAGCLNSRTGCTDDNTAMAGHLIAHALTSSRSATGRLDPNGETFVTHSLRADGFDASEDGTGRGTPLVPVAFAQNQRDEVRTMEICGALAGEPGMKQQTYVAVAIQERAVSEGTSGPDGKGWQEDVAFTLEARHRPQNVSAPMGVRRLTPTEAERLQGFEDDYTLVPYRGKLAADGPRYRALGNSMAVPVMRWIGERITKVHSVLEVA